MSSSEASNQSVISTGQMRRAEAEAMAQDAVSGLDLMERAGMAVADAICDNWRSPGCAHNRGAARKGVVLCGPGNNGGDGFAVARLLAQRGWDMRVLFVGQRDTLSPEARANHDRWGQLGPLVALDRDDAGAVEPDVDLVVDALFGIGLTRPIDAFVPLLGTLPRAAARVAIDVPSGLCADTGRLLLGARNIDLRADLTVTFHCLKPGHLLADGPLVCGQITVADIGLVAPGRDDRVAVLAAPGRYAKTGGHKFDYGHGLIIAGGAARGGAARLAARAALRSGAGLVTIAPPVAALIEHAGPPDALMRRGLDGPAGLNAILGDDRISALCMGPGCGIERAAQLLPAVIESGRACVLDADALTALARRDDPFAGLHGGIVLTPHMGEFQRLFPDLAHTDALDEPRMGTHVDATLSKLDMAKHAAARSGAIMVLKGPDTVIATPAGTAFIHSAFDLPWLATAGAGDVLSGIITAMLARAPDAHGLAVQSGVWLHAAAARRIGAGLIADDLCDAIGGVFCDMGL